MGKRSQLRIDLIASLTPLAQTMSASVTTNRPVSPPPLCAKGVVDPEVDNYRSELEEYIAGLSEVEILAYKITAEAMEGSYTIVRSKGFLSWMKKNKGIVIKD
jgi:hypothetical protein